MRCPWRCHIVLVVLLLLHLIGVTEAGLFGGGDSNDLYAQLGLKRGATKDEIKKAFRKLTREHHPDLQETLEEKDAAKEHMVKVLRAYKVLSDDIQRQDYDRFGKIPGEQLNAADFTADELFEHFSQQSPILSKTRQLESLRLLRRILNFRGNRVFLVQVYDDTCKSCRWFAQTWESFAQSSMVEGSVVEMLRIDAYAPEGPSLLSALGIKYKAEVQVLAIVDGEQWQMPQLASALKSKSARSAFSGLHDFIMNFFHDKQMETMSLKSEDNPQSILKWLQEERGPDNTVRVLAPPLAREGIVLTLSVLHEDVAVFRSVPRAALLSFIDEICGQTVEVRNRDGEVVPVPEFVVVSLGRLPNATEAVADEGLNGTDSCRGIHVGASAALTYRKAATFVKDLLPPRHSGMVGIPYMTGMLFYEMCRQHCLIWVRDSCKDEPRSTWMDVLRGDYKPFGVGYVCMDEEVALRAVLLPTATATPTKDMLVAIVDGDEDKLHVLECDPQQKHISEALSRLLLAENEDHPMELSAPLSRLLTSRTFQLSQMQYYYLLFQSLIGVLYPIGSNCYPFLMMFIMHKVLQRFNLLGNNDASNNTSGTQRGGTSNSSTSTSAPPTTSAAAAAGGGGSGNTNKGGIRSYTAADLEAAKSGRGFLILLFQDGDKPCPALPNVANDARFTLRLVSPKDAVWGPWLALRQPQSAKDAPDTGKRVDAVAVRQGRMTAAVKPPYAALDSWLCDLLDGTVTASLSLPTE
ncbi:DnaJ chaperone protein [Trypanosoma grayi]|uniref:DnaJ chaperone protein n=1 Tax=Trypanosoma grayi TaxID=71804 RepID=UPI0004F4AF11|nr:DnaJ chaperone protein [Trypanosoma grayi]KEG12479.1 DnaJ chaperone protein [Trypanosoma grayi]